MKFNEPHECIRSGLNLATVIIKNTAMSLYSIIINISCQAFADGKVNATNNTDVFLIL